MTRLLHISDLHFGAVDDRLVPLLLAAAQDLRPDVTVISGDLTQRARPDQFEAARAFIDRLPGPVLVVPGNHDMPLWNLALRLLAPLSRYRAAIRHDVEPSLCVGRAVLQGVNTANPFVWKSGRLHKRSRDRLASTFGTAPDGAMRIAVLHHAPVPAADGTPADMAAPLAVLSALAGVGTDIVLSGHTHMPHAGFGDSAAGVLYLQVGTTISTRLKTDANDFALVEIEPDAVTVTSWLAKGGAAFTVAGTTRFRRTAQGWQNLDQTG